MSLKNLDILLPEHMFFPYEQFIYIWRLYYKFMCYILISYFKWFIKNF